MRVIMLCTMVLLTTACAKDAQQSQNDTMLSQSQTESLKILAHNTHLALFDPAFSGIRRIGWEFEDFSGCVADFSLSGTGSSGSVTLSNIRSTPGKTPPGGCDQYERTFSYVSNGTVTTVCGDSCASYDRSSL